MARGCPAVRWMWAATFIVMAGYARGALTPEQAQPVIEKRIASYREIGTAFKQIKDELKTSRPDVSSIRAAAQMIRSRGADMLHWFPPGSEAPPDPPKSWLDTLVGWFSSDSKSPLTDETKSHAKPAIWEHYPEFTQDYQRFKVEAERLQQITEGGQTAMISAQFTRLGQTCQTCHDRFRERLD